MFIIDGTPRKPVELILSLAAKSRHVNNLRRTLICAIRNQAAALASQLPKKPIDVLHLRKPNFFVIQTGTQRWGRCVWPDAQALAFYTLNLRSAAAANRVANIIVCMNSISTILLFQGLWVYYKSPF